MNTAQTPISRQTIEDLRGSILAMYRSQGIEPTEATLNKRVAESFRIEEKALAQELQNCGVSESESHDIVVGQDRFAFASSF